MQAQTPFLATSESSDSESCFSATFPLTYERLKRSIARRHNALKAFTSNTSNVGYIPQFIYLSDDTIRNNIAFGIPEGEISAKKISAAVKASQLEELMVSLDLGLDTIIGERGVRLSGGQRQRIGIARALYDNPEVLIMDEATSALDNATEKEIIKAIESLKGQRTIIMIAHRLTTVMNCDMLFMLNDGELVTAGAYQELIDGNECFKKMATES